MTTICHNHINNYNGYYKRNTRRGILRKKLILTCILFIVIILFSVLSVKLFVFADDGSKSTSTVKYTSVMIYCGDSVDSIAEQYSANPSDVTEIANEICSINHILSDDTLIPGNYLIVPIRSL